MYTQKTFVPKGAEIEKKWYIIDATDVVVGRLASEVASILRGKTKTSFTPNADVGDHVIVTNCEKVKFTGKKWSDKIYYRHSGYIGGLKQRTAQEQLDRKADLIIYNAVKGMLPKTSLGRKQLTKLRVYAGEAHEQEAQTPIEYKVKG